MLLTLDTGNTSVTAAVFDGGRLRGEITRHRTDPMESEADYDAFLRGSIGSAYGITAVAVSSVVPSADAPLCGAARRIFGCEPFLIKSGDVRFADGSAAGSRRIAGFKIAEPSVLGADLICDAAAAVSLYDVPCVIADLGTVTKLLAVDKNGDMLGGAFCPGVRISFELFWKNTAALPQSQILAVEKPINNSTAASMSEGVVIGTAAMVDEMSRRYEEILGKSTLLLTGGHSTLIRPHLRRDFVWNPALTNEGIRIIHSNMEEIKND